MDAGEFLEFLLRENVLRFGDFVLKSGRRSPYFFDLGAVSSGPALDFLGTAYAARISAMTPLPDMLFGPAYKGIPIAVATSVALARDHGINLDIAFDRKEAKEHGEGGRLVGGPVDGRRTLIVDDVVTDGKAKVDAYGLLRDAGAEVAGVLVALDRRERVDAEETGIQSLARRLGVPVLSIVTLDDLVAYLQHDGGKPESLETILRYRSLYCVS
ncbi:MAG: orotate phosphoribosyltransferase [Gammaproteobacteria bacterium]|nr:orotate phosphoribosyltransferase [Gammaproteobacteria bacterium]